MLNSEPRSRKPANIQPKVPPCWNCGAKVAQDEHATIWYICKGCRTCSPAVFAQRTKARR